MPTETVHLVSYVTSNPGGSAVNPDNALGSPDGTFTGETTGTGNVDHRWRIATPLADVVNGGTLEVMVRRSANAVGTLTAQIRLYDATPTLFYADGGTAITSDVGQVITANLADKDPAVNPLPWDLMLRMGHGGATAGSVQVDAASWSPEVIAQDPPQVFIRVGQEWVELATVPAAP